MVKCGRSVTLTTDPFLVSWSRKSTAIPLLPQCLYSTAIPLLPQCLYSTAIPLLPLQAVWPVQSLSACTVQLHLYSPYGPYSLYRASVREQYSYTSTPLSACTVQLYLYSPYRPYSLYRASVPVQYSYTSTPPIGRTASTDPQCLYSTAIPLLPYGPY